MKEQAGSGHGDSIDATTSRVRGEKAHIHIADALDRLVAAGTSSVLLFEHGSLQVKMYAPRGHDPQTLHARDELYVVARGSGIFYDGATRRGFEVGDLRFAPAGSEHRFEDFTGDFAVWVMFYGPEGGEGSQPHFA
ncbi:MAG TPA: cupin domain-containing protein [Blastocatellia bacterium]|nr:cupin domain-containing protein [Blastocatellia bacterium]